MMREGRIARAGVGSKSVSEQKSWQEEYCTWNTAATILLGIALMFLGYMTIGPGLGGQKHLYVAPTHTVDTIGGFRGAAKSIKLIESTTMIDGYGRISYIEAKPPTTFSQKIASTRPNLLFLPDSTHSIEGLKSMHMLEVYAQHGYHCYAVDLPGTGTIISKRSKVPQLSHKKKMDYSSFNNYDAWMRGLFQVLNLRQTVVISMGSSSWYGLSLLYHSGVIGSEKDANGAAQVRLKGADSSFVRGMVFVAPHRVSIKNTEERLRKVQLPILLLRGDLDDPQHVSENMHFLGSAPQFQSITVPRSGRYPFEIQFTRFNTELMSFLIGKCAITKPARKMKISGNSPNKNTAQQQQSNVKSGAGSNTQSNSILSQIKRKNTQEWDDDDDSWVPSEEDDDDLGIDSEDVLGHFFQNWGTDDGSNDDSAFEWSDDDDDDEGGRDSGDLDSRDSYAYKDDSEDDDSNR